MRVAFVQTYPVYHDLLTQERWLALENRDRWMPGVLAAMGHNVELWAGAREAAQAMSRLDGFGDYPIRLFPTRGDGRTKFHYSDVLVDHARTFAPDLCILKGVDGGVGERLIRAYLAPARIPYAFVIGGKYYTRNVPRARFVFYETDAQRKHLMRPGGRFWRRRVLADRLIRLPKSVDTQHFCPRPGTAAQWDVLGVGRLVPHVKNYDALGRLSEEVTVAVAGGGPDAERLQAAYPKVTWLGHVPHHEMPGVMNRARLLFHTSTREFYPRVIAEAAACGLPAVAFAEAVAADVLPPERGLRVRHDDYVAQIRALLDDADRRAEMSCRCRIFAVASLAKDSSRGALQEMLRRVETPAPDDEAIPSRTSLSHTRHA